MLVRLPDDISREEALFLLKGRQVDIVFEAIVFLVEFEVLLLEFQKRLLVLFNNLLMGTL